MKYYILKYYLADNYLERRSNFREEHLRLADELQQKGKLLLGGALTDPTDEALLVFYVNDKYVIEDFVSKDPYIKNGFILKWEIREWNVVIGKN
ncbi:MAG TPA: hypothetical protein DHV28_16235 [Ignavibacteriales bacterium]|nr:hypothetical protein [Ignavibacteriales bacterium]